jgi:glyoxylase-like metal-dependent hydrolase (beta-lactamase superfamily II)/ferredoxin
VASPRRRLATNAPGDFYVDETCIDCGACRWMAPATFDSGGDQSRVHAQPEDAAADRRALLATIACPTGSIGAEGRDLSEAKRAFPVPIDGPVFHAGYHSEKSFGATPYFIARREGNVLVDSPRWNRLLADRLEALGGVSILFLTHRDDVADHERWADRFGARRLIHAEDRMGLRGVDVFDGIEPIPIAADLVILPTPGHTEGSSCLLYRDRYLFTGDHLAYDPERDRLYAFRSACWYDWRVQTESMRSLAKRRFEWVLPGHGDPVHLDADRMAAAMAACVGWMSR